MNQLYRMITKYKKKNLLKVFNNMSPDEFMFMSELTFQKILDFGIYIDPVFDDIDDNILSWLRTNQDVYDDIVKVTDDQFFISLAIKNIPETFLLAKDKTVFMV